MDLLNLCEEGALDEDAADSEASDGGAFRDHSFSLILSKGWAAFRAASASLAGPVPLLSMMNCQPYLIFRELEDLEVELESTVLMVPAELARSLMSSVSTSCSSMILKVPEEETVSRSSENSWIVG